jgi:hypothetical protein
MIKYLGKVFEAAQVTLLQFLRKKQLPLPSIILMIVRQS